MRNNSSSRTAATGRALILAACAAGVSLSGAAQSWQRVVNLNDTAGSAIGGGSGNTLYAGLSSGHVFRSTDNGVTWTGATNGLVDSFGRILLPNAFVVGANGRVLRGGPNASWQNRIGSPLFYSDNQGATWIEVPLPFGSATRNPAGISVSDLVVHQGALYFSDVLSEGVWKSTDNGLTWVSAGEQLPTMPFVGNTKTYNAVASAGNALLTVQVSKGVFRSTDSGVTWAQAVNGIPGVVDSPLVGGRSWSGSDVVGAADGTAFAAVDSRLYRSRDGGASWVEVGAGVLQSPNPFVPTVILPSVRKVELLGDRVFVTSTDSNPRFFEGTSLGDSWTELPRVVDNNGNAGVLAQSFYAYNGALYFAGNKGIHRLDLATAVRTNFAPVVSTAPAGPFGLNVGGTLKIAASARGTAPFTYEWRLNDAPIAGQTAAELNFTATSTNQSGTLSLIVRNTAGAVTNQLGQLTVALAGPGFVDYSFRPQTSGSVTAFAIAPDGGVFYGGPFSSQVDAYTGVRRTFADGQIDPAFVTGAVIGAGSGPGLSVGSPRGLLPLGDGSVLVGATDTGDNQRYYRRLLPNGAQDAAWPWPTETAGGPRKFLQLPDGKFLVAGGSVGGIHRLNPDGSFDATFQSPAGIGRFQANYVSDFAVLPSGRILIVGKFNEVDSTPRVGIARLLANGTLDRSWVPAQFPLNSTTVNALAVQADGKILLGGSFASVGGQTRRGLARLNPDGSLDTTLGDVMPNISPAPAVNALALQPDGKVWVGGNFFAFGGNNYLVRLNSDGTLDAGMPSVGLETSGGGAVNALKLTDDGRLWIGAVSATVRGQFIGNLFRIFTDLTGPTLGYGGPDQTPDVGGSVTLRGTVTGPFTGLQWRFKGAPINGQTSLNLALSNVTLATSGAYDLVVTSAGGSYTSAPVNVRVRGPVVIDQEPLPAVGIISNSVSFAVSAFGKLSLSYQWLKDGSVLPNATNRTLTLTNLQLTAAGDYAVKVTGGDATTATTEPAYLSVIPRPGAVDPSFAPKLFPTKGNFTYTLNGIGFAGEGRVLVSGRSFTTVSNSTADLMLVRLNADGAADDSFHFDPSGLTEFVTFKVQPDGRIVVLVRSNEGGGPYVVRRLNADGSPDASFAPFTMSPAYGLDLGPDGSVFVIGNAIVRLSPTGIEDTGFGGRAQVNSSLQSVSVDPAGRVYITGNFTAVGGVARPQIARLLPDGSLDASFAPTNNFVSGWTVTALADGAMVSDFQGFYRLNEAGRVDPGYAWSQRLVAFDRMGAGGLVGVLPATDVPQAVILAADGTGALPFNRINVPRSASGPYTFIRVGPDGAFWVGYGGSIAKLSGTVTPLSLLTSPKSQTVNAGANVTFTVAATGTSKVRYQWQRNGENLTGETNATLVFNGAQPANNGDYTVVVSNRSGSQTSGVATLVVLAAPEILSLSGGGELGLGNTLLLSVNARGVAPLTYRWRRNGSPVAGAETASYTNRAVTLADAGSYDVIVGNSLGSVTSAPVAVTVTVRPGAVITSFPPDAGSTLGVTELNVLSNGLYLSGGSAYNRFGELQFSLPYPYNGAPGSSVLRDRVAVDAANGRIYMGPTYRVRAFELGGALVDSYAGPAANVRLVRVEASGTVLEWTEGSLTYTLKRLGPDGALAGGFNPPTTMGVDAQPLADGKILLLSASQRIFQGNFVFDTTVVRLNADGTLDSSFNAATNVFPLGQKAERLAVDRQGRFFVLGGFNSYNGQPRTSIARFLADGTLDPDFLPAVINGSVMELAEQVNGKLVIVGAFTQVDGQSRSLIARLNADGSHDLSFNPGTGLTTTGGQNIAYDVALLPTGEILVAGTFNRADGLIRTGLALLTGDTTDLYFTHEPADAVLNLGGAVDLVAAGTGTTAVTYQWFKDGSPLNAQTGPVLNLANATANTAGDYRVVIRNAAGELASRVARVAVVLPPVITQPPVSRVANVGQDITFSVAATGLSLSYQWHLGDNPIAKATNASFTVVSAKAVDAGRYSVTVSNPAGAATSPAALLRLRPVLAEAGGLPTNGLAAEVLFEGGFVETENRFATTPRGTPTLVDGHGGGQAARFRGGADWLQLGGGNTRFLNQSYTASCWFWPEEGGSINLFAFDIFAAGQARETYLILGGADGTIQGSRLRIVTRGSLFVESVDDRAYVPNLVGKWNHLAVVFQGNDPGLPGDYTVYLNGEVLPLINGNTGIAGGANGNGLGKYAPATPVRMDDFRAYSRPLSANEVGRIFNPTPPDPKPEITRQPNGGSAAAGASFSLVAEATGANLFYEWYRGDTLLPDVDGPVLQLQNVSAADAGDYRVVISNSGGSTTSAVATVVVGAVADPFVAWASAAGLSGDNAQPGADGDGDGANNLAEFYYGTSPTAGAERPAFPVANVKVGDVDYPAVTIVRRKAAGTAQLTTQVASSVLFHDDLGSTVVSTTPLGNGFERVVIRSNAPEAGQRIQFFRFIVQQ